MCFHATNSKSCKHFSKGLRCLRDILSFTSTFSIFVQAPIVISTVTMIFSGPKGKQKVHKTLGWVLQQKHSLLLARKMYSLTQHSFVLWISKVTIVCLSMYYLSIIYLCIYLSSICMYMCSLCVYILSCWTTKAFCIRRKDITIYYNWYIIHILIGLLIIVSIVEQCFKINSKIS